MDAFPRRRFAMMTAADAQKILATANLIEIGVRADEARKARHGDRVTFVRVFDLQVSGPAPGVIPREAGEVRVTGRPDSLAQAESLLLALKQTVVVPGFSRATLTGFALHDLEHLGAFPHVAARLKECGLEMIAEAAIDRLSNPAESIRSVHSAGLEVARLTFHEPQPDAIAALQRVRDAAAASPGGVARACAPLPRRLDSTSPTTGYDDVKLVALARLFLDNVERIQIDWTLYGPKLAQVALTFGADDLDAVPLDPIPVNLLGPRRAPLEEVMRNIRAASFVPVQRNGRFDPIAAPETAASR
jgi:aminodeoxyfutalosine synthase